MYYLLKNSKKNIKFITSKEVVKCYVPIER